MPDTSFEQVTQRIDAARDELQQLTRQLYAQQINIAQWEIASAGVIKDTHLAASAYARGGVDAMGFTEYGRVGGAYADELRYLHRFAGDIQAGRLSEAQALARIDQYGEASQQAYWREYSRLGERGEKIWWELSAAESCEDCKAMAAGSPYQPSELTKYPGSGATTCRGRCRCGLSRRSE